METRPETGKMKFGDDWSGIFIRGDNAFNYHMQLKEVLKDNGGEFGIIAKHTIRDLIDLLESCEEHNDIKPQKLKSFEECRYE